MEKEPLFIAFASQKGGVGKTAFTVLTAGILHYQRVGEAETAEVIVNRSEHIIVEPLASGKHTEVNPMGFTIVVEENGHNPNHSYYDIK